MNTKHNSIIKIIVFTYILFFSLSVKAQNGIIKGQVFDSSTDEELIGATVLIEGTVIGCATDLDGNYKIPNIPYGTYNIVCRFISYDTEILDSIVVNSSEPISLNFKLNSSNFQLKTFQVEAKAINKTENALLTMKSKAPTAMDGISSQEFGKTNSSDAASALKNVTGLSVEDNKYVYVRGLGDRYSLMELNGATIPGLDPNRNTVQLDLFPTNIIDNITVNKTSSPDLPGSFSGGYVNINTKDFPEKYTFQFSASIGFNTQSSFNKDYMTYKGGSLDFIGIDDGTRIIPTIATKGTPGLYVDNERLDNITKSFNKTWEPENKMSALNHSMSLSVGNQKKLFDKPIGFIIGLSYQRKYNHFNDGVTGRYKLTGSSANTLNKELELDDNKSCEEVLWGIVTNVSYKLSSNHKIGFNIITNHSSDKTSRYQIGVRPEDAQDMFFETRTLQFRERSLISGQLLGENNLPTIKKLKVKWISSYTLSLQDEPDLRFFTNDFNINTIGDTLHHIQASLYPVPTRYFRNMLEHNWDNKAHFEIPFQLLNAESTFKFGGAYVMKNREFTEERFDFKSQNHSYNGNINEYMSDDNIGSSAGGIYGIYVQDASEDRNNYSANQSIAAAYTMVDLNLFTHLRAIIGGRFEQTNINVASMDTSLTEGILNNSDFLPSINLRWAFGKKTNLRVAFTRTLARPSFRELAPVASFNFVGDFVLVGNPNLERTLIDNIDLRYEYFPNLGEIISISAFYKGFTNPIERSFNPISANPELTYSNVDEAELYGAEFEFRKKLSFIPILKNYKIGMNFTYVYSFVNIDQDELEAIHATDPTHSDTRIMFGQSPITVNALLSYENQEKGLKANLSYNYSGNKLAVVIVGGTPDIYTQASNGLNFNISKIISEKWSLKLSANNLLDQEYKQTYTYLNKEYIYQSYTKGRTFSISINYLIE